MNEIPSLVLSLTTGGLLGAIFFGGLWWSIRQLTSADRPALWFVGCFFLRTSITLAGFVLVASGRWERFLACLVGFVTARLIVTWSTGTPRVDQACLLQEVTHAPES